MTERPAPRSPHRKRHGHHQKRTNHFMKVYKPFLPLLIITAGVLMLASVVGGPRINRASPVASTNQSVSEPSVLAYATGISTADLLGESNSRRATAGVGNLSINGQLTTAAQAKANDMANRNYWSHNTPDGSPPWVFISNAGYSYSKAGENLACGFNRSVEVITGWYNSPTHRDNLLHPDYKDVGFGVANADGYNCGDIEASQQTIIVAMYGTPYVAKAAATPPPPPVTTTTTKKTAVVSPVQTSTPSNEITSHTVILTVTNTAGKPSKGIKASLHSDPQVGYTDDKGSVTFSNVASGKHTVTLEINGAKSVSDIDLTNSAKEYKLSILEPELVGNKISNDDVKPEVAEPKKVSKLQLLTNGNYIWVLAFLVIAAVSGGLYVFVKHSLAAHKFIVKGERYIMTHKLLDLLVIALIVALYFLTRTVGSIL